MHFSVVAALVDPLVQPKNKEIKTALKKTCYRKVTTSQAAESRQKKIRKQEGTPEKYLNSRHKWKLFSAHNVRHDKYFVKPPFWEMHQKIEARYLPALVHILSFSEAKEKPQRTLSIQVTWLPTYKYIILFVCETLMKCLTLGKLFMSWILTWFPVSMKLG